jgi:pimeloyl-ACP methyl ester carboxylesterase
MLEKGIQLPQTPSLSSANFTRHPANFMPLLKLLPSLLGTVALAYIAACAILMLSQRRLIFVPSPLLVGTPRELGLAYDDVWISVDPTTKANLHGWWVPAHAPAPPLTVLYLHGNAGNVSSHLDRVARWRSLGLSVLIIDYRGYGLSSGPFPTETRLYADAAAALDFLQQEKHIPTSQILIYGHSIGGAVAIDLASHAPQVAGLVVESSFTSMADMATVAGYNRWFPVQWLLTQRFDSLPKVPHLQVPTLYLHGLADEVVPPAMGRQLYDATNAPKDLWFIPEADHNTIPPQSSQEFGQRIDRFIQQQVESKSLP